MSKLSYKVNMNLDTKLRMTGLFEVNKHIGYTGIFIIPFDRAFYGITSLVFDTGTIQK